jgi:K+-sensing histidine kinase KdpD
MEGQDSNESRSLGSRARDAAKRVTGPLASATRAVTGKDVEQQVAEYTETFTQVALGLHEDLEASSRRIGELEATVVELRHSIQELRHSIEAETVHEPQDKSAQDARIWGATPVAIAALAVAAVALGVSIWIAL